MAVCLHDAALASVDDGPGSCDRNHSMVICCMILRWIVWTNGLHGSPAWRDRSCCQQENGRGRPPLVAACGSGPEPCVSCGRGAEVWWASCAVARPLKGHSVPAVSQLLACKAKLHIRFLSWLNMIEWREFNAVLMRNAYANS